MTEREDRPPAVLTQALAFCAAGCSVVPAMSDGSKAPAGSWKQAQSTPATPERITAWFSADGRHPGMGVVCGAVSGNLLMLELEGRAVHLLPAITALVHAAGLRGVWDRLFAGYMEATPGGGLHFLLRVTGMAVPGNTKLASRPATDAELAERPDDKIKVLIETRGEGGFVITAPSNGATHPTGRPWVLLAGGPESIPVLTGQECEALLALLRTFDEMPVPAAPTPPALPSSASPSPPAPDGPFSRPARPAPVDGGVSPADDYDSRTTWPEILSPLGWTEVYHKDGTTYWRRPGKDVGVSATTRAGRGDGFWVFSTSTEFEAGRSYTRFGVYALLRHGGDFSAAARSLKAQGYGSLRPAVPPLTPFVPVGLGVVDVELPAEVEEQPELYPIVDWGKAYSAAPEDIDWLCEPLIERGRSYALYSPPKAGKSLLSLEIAAALSCGRAVLGNVPLPPVRVLYVDMENTVDELVERLTAMGYRPEDLDDLRYLSFPSLPALDSRVGGEHLLAVAQLHEADLVFLDTVSRMVEGEENDSGTYLALYRYSLVPLKARGVSTIRLDHSGKDLALGQRGSSAKSGDVDAVWRMTKRMETRTSVVIDLVRTDSRNAHGADALTLTRRYHPLRHEVAQEGGPGPEVLSIVERLDDLDVPKEHGRDRVRALLAGLGVTAPNAVLSAAIKHRKTKLNALKPVRGQVDLAEADEEVFSLSTDSPGDDDKSAGQPVRGQVRTGAKNGAGATADAPVRKWGCDEVTPIRTGSTPDGQAKPLCRDCGEPMSYDDGSGFHPTCGREPGDS